MTAKLAKARCRIYEVGISYNGRTYSEVPKRGETAVAPLSLRLSVIDEFTSNQALGTAP